MKLYHFAPQHLSNGIIINGITDGMTPIQVCNAIAFFPKHQWLTQNSTFKQSWEEGSSLSYRRNAVRFTIKIPKNYQDNVWDMEYFKDRFGNYLLEDFFATPDYEDWRVYSGDIPKAWIKQVKQNPID